MSKSETPKKSFLRSVGTGFTATMSAIGTALETAAENAREQERQQTRHLVALRSTDLAYRLTPEDLDALSMVFKDIQATEQLTTVHLINGHLSNCRPHCNTKHCLRCGDSVIGTSSPYCFSCR